MVGARPYCRNWLRALRGESGGKALENSAISPPHEPIAAATRPASYAYYEILLDERPLAFDCSHGMWVAASAAAVTTVLTDIRCHVRPPTVPEGTWAMHRLTMSRLRRQPGASTEGSHHA